MERKINHLHEIIEMVQKHQISSEEGLTLIKKFRSNGGSKTRLEQQRPENHCAMPGVESQRRSIPHQPGAGDIAIIGISGRFSDASDVDEFWRHMESGKDSVREIPRERWTSASASTMGIEDIHASEYRWGGFLSEADRFDPLFFSISPREAEIMDPQQRLFLQEAWKALEDAGYSADDLNDKKCGVFVGGATSDYSKGFSEREMLDPYLIIGNSASILPARISYFLNLKGPSLAVDTACSSSLVAVHLACESIRNETSEMAIAGGVMVMCSPDMYINFDKAGMISPGRRCRTFDNSADGFVPGEGVGAVVLKPLRKALEEGDHIYGVIKGSEINQDGKTNGITAPSAPSQTNLECSVYDRLSINPETITYVETHGTGTKLGDPIEIQALTAAFRKYTAKKQYCAVGSVKTNIGHALTAAGIAGLIKVLLCLKYKKIPPVLHFSKTNEHISFPDSPFYVPDRLTDWSPEGNIPRRAAISSFGFSGTNCHIVVEEAPVHGRNSSVIDRPSYLITLSAKTEAAFHQRLRDLRDYLSREGRGQGIGDIAYTLHRGRGHYAVRSALIVRDRDELQRKLAAIIAGEQVPGYLYNVLVDGRVKEEPAMRLFGQKLIDEISQDGLAADAYGTKLLALADLYTKGYSLDWRRLYGAGVCNRLSLPTYPFARERYWISPHDKPVSREDTGPHEGGKSGPHPLVGANISTFDEIQFTTRLTGEEFYLSNHVINGEMILPGVVFLEMARAAGVLAGKKQVTALKNIAWLRPVVLREKGQALFIGLRPNHDPSVIDVELSSRNKDGKSDVHARGTLITAPAAGHEQDGETVDIAGIKKRCVENIDGKTCYRLYREKGLDLGPGFRVIQELFASETESLALLRLPEELEYDFADFGLHPSLMDGALQSSIGLSLGRREELVLHVPFALSHVEIRGALKRTCYAHVQAGDPGSGTVDVRILDESGTVLVKMGKIEARVLHAVTRVGDQSADKGISDMSRLYFHPVWERREIDRAAGESFNANDRIIVFDHTRDVFDAVNTRMTTINGRKNVIGPYLVLPAEEYQNIGNGVYQINPGSMTDYQRLLSDLGIPGASTIRIIHNWSQGRSPNHANNGKLRDVRAQLDEGIYSLFSLTQAFLQQYRGQDADIRMLYFYPGHDERSLPLYAAVNGFARSLALECAHVRCRTVELETGHDQQQAPDASLLAELVLQELSAGSGAGAEVRYEEGKRWSRSWKEITLSRNDEHFTIGKEEGVYIITGGAGGLGMIFARQLAKNGHAKLILAGRSDMHPDIEANIKELESLGSEVMYIKADVSRYEDAKHLIHEAKSRFKTIHGIIHSAGTTRDAFVQSKRREDMEAVLAPKVQGTRYLDEATKDEPLDFFVLFSSLAAVLGNAGQSDYAYANGYMDYYADMREDLRKEGQRSGKTLSINWPLWRNGGLRADKQTEENLHVIHGIALLETESGLRSLSDLLASDESRVVVLEGDAGKIRKIMEMNSNPDMHDRIDCRTGDIPESAEAERELLQEIGKDILRMVSGVVKMKDHHISLDKNLTEYGFDSISFGEFSGRINKAYRLDLSPAVFFEYPSIRAFSRYLLKEHSKKMMHHYRDDAGEAARTGVGSEQKEAVSVKNRDGETRFQPRPFETVYGTAMNSQKDPVAIIGMSGVLPQSDDLDSFWAHLEAGNDLITTVPRDRWEGGGFQQALDREHEPNRVFWGGFMKEVDKFDPLFFGISPREGELMDPQHRIFLETVWKTIEDAGYRVSDLAGSKTAVFVGVSTSDYADIVKKHNVPIEGHSATGMSHSVLANRASYLFDFHGPSEPIDTACSSSLIAVHRAVEAIQSGNCDMAIAGGVNVLLTPDVFISFSKAGMLSEDGRCKTFDQRANGYVRGEGVGAVFLKPLSRAIQDGDHIYAVVKATGVNHGGHASSLTAPNMIAQSDLLIEVYEKSGCDPSTIGYIEAHGTGTNLGDPIEVDGLKRAFHELYRRRGKLPQKNVCGIGSVKTNIGHLEAAAGIAGLLKILLAIKHQKLPASLHVSEVNPYIQLENSPFYVVREARKWEQLRTHDDQPIPRRAGVSSFGFGGANAHIIIEEYAGTTKTPIPPVTGAQVIVLSAKDEERLIEYARNMAAFLDKSVLDLTSLAYTLQTGREPLEKRLAIIASSTQEARDKLACYARRDADIADCYQGSIEESRSLSAFLLDGDEGKEYLRIIIRDNKIEKAAQLWVSGIEIDWKGFYRGKTPQRVPLPTYPFARTRHWVAMNGCQPSEPGPAMSPATQPGEPRGPIREVLLAHDPKQRFEIVKAYLLKQLSTILKLPHTHALDSKKPLVSLGLDSLMALQLKQLIETDFSMDVSFIKLLGGEDTEDLAAMILRHFEAAENGAASAQPAEEAIDEHSENTIVEGVL